MKHPEVRQEQKIIISHQSMVFLGRKRQNVIKNVARIKLVTDQQRTSRPGAFRDFIVTRLSNGDNQRK
jgi:hypothetical protein